MEGRGLRRAKGIVRGAGGEVKEIGGLKLGQSRRIPRVKAMNQKQIEGFKKSLQTRRQELLRSITQTQQEGSTAQQAYGHDEGDRATSSLNKELSFLQNTQARKLLQAVEAALGRISEGSFGECLNCGSEINVKRLEAIPWVRYCVTCQELIEEQG